MSTSKLPKPKNKTELRDRMTAAGIRWTEDMTIEQLLLREKAASIDPASMTREALAKTPKAVLAEVVQYKGLPPLAKTAKQAEYVDALFALNQAEFAREQTAKHQMPLDVLRRISGFMDKRDQLRMAVAMGDRDMIRDVVRLKTPTALIGTKEDGTIVSEQLHTTDHLAMKLYRYKEWKLYNDTIEVDFKIHPEIRIWDMRPTFKVSLTKNPNVSLELQFVYRTRMISELISNVDLTMDIETYKSELEVLGFGLNWILSYTQHNIFNSKYGTSLNAFILPIPRPDTTVNFTHAQRMRFKAFDDAFLNMVRKYKRRAPKGKRLEKVPYRSYRLPDDSD